MSSFSAKRIKCLKLIGLLRLGLGIGVSTILLSATPIRAQIANPEQTETLHPSYPKAPLTDPEISLDVPHVERSQLDQAKISRPEQDPTPHPNIAETPNVVWTDPSTLGQHSLAPAEMKLSDYFNSQNLDLAQNESPDLDRNSSVDSTSAQASNHNKKCPSGNKDRSKMLVIDNPGIDAGIKYESLDNNFDDWSEVFVAGEHRFDEQTSVVYGKFRTTERFDLSDQEFLLGFFTLLDRGKKKMDQDKKTRRWGIGAEGTISPSHEVLPEWSLSGKIKHALVKDLRVEAGFNRTEFTQTEFNQEYVRVELGGNFQVAYRLEFTQVADAGNGVSHLLEAKYYYACNDDSNFALKLLAGEIIEDQPDFVLRNDVVALIAEGKHLFSQHWGLTYNFNVWEQDEQYTRVGGGLGVRYQF